MLSPIILLILSVYLKNSFYETLLHYMNSIETFCQYIHVHFRSTMLPSIVCVFNFKPFEFEILKQQLNFAKLLCFSFKNFFDFVFSILYLKHFCSITKTFCRVPNYLPTLLPLRKI